MPSSVSKRPSSGSSETQKHGRILRAHLEALATLERDREQTVRMAQTLAHADDIQPRILKAASGFQRLVEVEPAMFEEISDEELLKYDRYIQDITESEAEQSELLASIKVRRPLSYSCRMTYTLSQEPKRAVLAVPEG